MRTDWISQVNRVAALRLASSGEATFWVEVDAVRNISIKDYEEPNMGDSARQGDLMLRGRLRIKPKGAIWDVWFQVNHRVSLSEHAPSGSVFFSVATKDPIGELVDMALLEDKAINAVLSALGKVPYVPYESRRAAAGLPNKMQVKKLMQQAGIPGEVSGAGAKWEVELPDEKAMKKFQKVVPGAGGFRTGYGGWIMSPGYQSKGDPGDPSSAWHYAAEGAGSVLVGDIFYSSWGYDQTNVDFYQVTKVGPAMIAIRQIDKLVVRGRGEPQEYVEPKPNVFDGPVMNKKLKTTYDGRPSVTLNSYSSAYKWDGKAKPQTGGSYGH